MKSEEKKIMISASGEAEVQEPPSKADQLAEYQVSSEEFPRFLSL